MLLIIAFLKAVEFQDVQSIWNNAENQVEKCLDNC